MVGVVRAVTVVGLDSALKTWTEGTTEVLPEQPSSLTKAVLCKGRSSYFQEVTWE